MNRYQLHRARRPLAWARRPSLAARILGEDGASLAPAPDIEPGPAPMLIAIGDISDEEPPFDPPDEDDDIFLGAASSFDEGCDESEEGEESFVPPKLLTYAAPADEQCARAPAEAAEEPQPDLFAFADMAPSALFEAAAAPEGANDHSGDDALDEALVHDAAEDEEPPFDAPDECDDVFGPTFERTAPLTAAVAQAAPAAPEPVAGPQAPLNSGECPAPPIHIHAAWDRPEIGALLECLRDDHRLVRADIEIARGGIDAAVMRFAGQASPNLLIIDTTLRRAEMLSSLDRLAQTIDPDCKIIILGALNDIGLLRELALRGVSEYIVPPVRTEDLARAVCRLYAQNDQSRVIAVVGARGGVGASTIAQNLAWSIAERQDACAALIDLDLAFGAAAFSIGKSSPQSVADALDAPDAITDEMLARATVQCTKHLQVLTAPATLERAFEIDPDAVEALVHHARRANQFVVLDLPHAWAPWVKQTLAHADEIVLVAGPDLASLRNSKSMLEAIAPLRQGKSAPLVALSMVGVPKRPEINAKDFTEAIGTSPAASFAFDPFLFGLCETRSQMIGEVDPDSKIACTLDTLAAALTGRKPSVRKRAADPAILAREGAADFAKSPKRGARHLSPAANDNVLVLTRETSIGTLSAAFANDPEGAYLAKARNAAQAGLAALAEEKRPRIGWGRIGVAACVAGVALAAGAWRAQTQRDTEPIIAAPAIAAAATPAAPAPASQYGSALLMLGEGRVSEAAPLLRAAAEAGFAPAQHRLAKLYERGDGLAADPVLARAWTERAAANGNVAAMHDLGVYYAQGEAASDNAAAFRWFRQAAEFGVADSQYNLGVLYYEGRGVHPDSSEALFWFSVAAAQGDAEAAQRAQALSAGLPQIDRDRAEARARAFRPRAPDAAANPQA
jgi:pilus assembly protein CpaE